MKNRSYLLRLGAIRIPIKILPKPVLYKDPRKQEYLEIGEMFQHKGDSYIVVEHISCSLCDCCIAHIDCHAHLRPDKKNVMFKTF